MRRFCRDRCQECQWLLRDWGTTWLIWVDKLGGMSAMKDLVLEMENVIYERAYGRDIAEEEQSLQIGRILTKWQ